MSSEPTRVLVFSLVYYPKYVGGAEVAIKEITDRIDPADIEFHMVCLRLDATLPRIEQVGNVRVYRIGWAKRNPTAEELVRFPWYLMKVWYPLLAAWHAGCLHRREGFDGAWAMMSYMGFPLVLLRFFGIRLPYVLTLQEGDTIAHITGRWRIRLVYPLYRLVFRYAVVVQTISTYLADFARSMQFSGRIEVIPNAVDTQRFSHLVSEKDLRAAKEYLGKTEDDVFLITTSRLVEKNAIDDVIVALTHVPEHIKFVVLGSGPLEQELKELARQHNLAHRVRFAGHVEHEQMLAYLQASDIFVRPSRSEGFGISFIEAMAAELPVIATQVGGISDFLFDARHNPEKEATGWAVDPDSPEQIAEAVERILADPVQTEKIVSNAQRMVQEQYDWDAIAVQMHTRVFTRLLQD